MSNLIKTKNGRSSYHDRYVEELQQAHSEYSRRIKEADMLESHIIQARTRAAATERQAYERMRERMGDIIDQQGLLTVKLNPGKPTLSYAMHVSKEPQDDGYTLIPSPEKIILGESDLSLTFESSSVTPTRRKPKEKSKRTVPRPKWKDEPSAKDREEGLEKLQKLKDRHNFLRNPRFLPPSAQQGGASLVRPRTKVGKKEHEKRGMEEQSSTDDPVFLATPSVVVFTDYTVGQVYETTLELKNLTSASRTVRVIPPNTPYFSIGLGRFPGEGGVVAPGMSCKYTVRFAPNSLGEFEDFLVVETQAEQLLVVPVMARRPPPILTFKFVEFLCQNVGVSAGTFCIVPKNQWPASNLRVVFFPTAAEKSCQMFTIVCDNCQVKDISIEGEGQLIALELVSVSGRKEPPVVGEVHDLTAEHFVRFSPCNPHSVQEKRVIIRNNPPGAALPLADHEAQPAPSAPRGTPEPKHIQFHPTTDGVFHVTPITGVLPPCQEQEFLFTFCPKEPVRTGSKVSDVIVMEIEVKGSTEPYHVLLEPYAVVIPGEIFICTTTCRQFKMWNHSRTAIFFQWEQMKSSCHIIEVQPSAGTIEENECFDFDLILNGGKPERVVTSLVCHIEHRHEPVTLAVEVSFKGPLVTLSVPSVDFGLLKLGEHTQTSLILTNLTQLEAGWRLQERQHQHPQVLNTGGAMQRCASPFDLLLWMCYLVPLPASDMKQSWS
ncbi:hypothetical protein F7725_029130 [Dissostichus mawsoni]|uniref:Deleted in lung and esophageal cancer protein 1 Ig-like domain-containing protein n=1 Tax=Dissostichus mawsoni TaxID=36200 RepID=A0A7J5XHJ6_DISMA|nr:hypothetical protein F7725_029130 [Dissostichus mawsoni]